MFEGFSETEIEAEGIAVHLVHGGTGPPLLLLHGYPQMRAMWHKLAPFLAESFTLVIPDLRGYGDSAKPKSDAAHLAYSKRSMARDQGGRHAGAWVRAFRGGPGTTGARASGTAWRSIFPTACASSRCSTSCPPTRSSRPSTKRSRRRYWLWFFLSQPADLPESIIGADPGRYLRTCLGAWSADSTRFSDEALAEYVRCLSDPETIHASCEDYRAAASIDLEHDEADLGAKIGCPVFALWSARRGAGRAPHDVMAAWRERAQDVRGQALDCGHFMPEEAPAETAAALSAFFG